MEINVVGRHMDVPDRFRRHLTDKLDKVTQFAPAALRVDVEISQEKNPRQAELSDRVDFIGVNTRDGAAQAAAFEEQFGVEYPSILDDETASGQLAFTGIVAPNAVPSTLILDADGRVAARVSGAVTDTSILSTLLREELER